MLYWGSFYYFQKPRYENWVYAPEGYFVNLAPKVENSRRNCDLDDSDPELSNEEACVVENRMQRNAYSKLHTASRVVWLSNQCFYHQDARKVELNLQFVKLLENYSQ